MAAYARSLSSESVFQTQRCFSCSGEEVEGSHDPARSGRELRGRTRGEASRPVHDHENCLNNT